MGGRYPNTYPLFILPPPSSPHGAQTCNLTKRRPTYKRVVRTNEVKLNKKELGTHFPLKVIINVHKKCM